MSDYSQTTDFSAKDALNTGDPLKAIVGAQIDAEFDAISVAIATKFDSTDLASQVVAEAGTNNTALMTPLRVAQLLGSSSAFAYKVKSADETVNGSTTLQDDDHLVSMSLDASSVYHVRGLLQIEIKAASDLKVLIVLDSAPTAVAIAYAGSNAAASSIIQNDNSTAVAVTTSSAETAIILIDGIIRTDGAAVAKLQWAQNTSQAEDTVLKTGSYLSFVKVS